MTEEARPRSRLSIRTYATGDVLVGKYMLERMLGEGGMGTVWLARNVTLDAPVALKLIRPELDLDEASDRLLKEARATAKIEHRAIVRVFDFGETEERDPFIVMELLDGKSLGDILDEQGKMSPIEIVQILLPVIDGLARAHEEGVVHRDLKPSNIFLAREGKRTQPKVVDFGIAKLDRYDTLPKLTRQGTVLGSPSYMAPEQARGLEDVDHRADIWTACVVLYEAVTGAVAFEGANYNSVLRSVIEDDVVPMTEFGVYDPALAAIVRRGLAKDREARFPTISDLGNALAQWLVSQGVLADVCGDSIEENWTVDFGSIEDHLGDDLAPTSEPLSSEALLLVNRKTPIEPLVVVRGDDDYEVRGNDDYESPSEMSIPPSELRDGDLLEAPKRGDRGLSLAAAILLGLALFIAAFGAVRGLRPSKQSAQARGSAPAEPVASLPSAMEHARPPLATDIVPFAAPRAVPSAARLGSPAKKDSRKWSPPPPSTAAPLSSAAGPDLKEPY